MHSLANSDDLQSMRERLGAMRPDDERLWGVMCAGEMVCHLRGAFRVAMGEIACKPVSLPIPRATIKAVALWAPIPWKHNFETVPALKRGTPDMRVSTFAEDRAEAIAQMERFCQPEQARVDHAFFGPMSFEDWMRWGFLHTDHHLRQFGR